MIGPKRHSHTGIGHYPPPLFIDQRKRFKSGGSSAPPSVDPSALANSQYQANIGTAQKQSELNNIRTTSPLGYTGFEQDANGRWNLTQNIADNLQPYFNHQVNTGTNITGLANDVANFATAPTQAGSDLVQRAFRNLGDQIPTGPVSLEGLPRLHSSLDFTGLTRLPTSATDFRNDVSDAENAAYNTQARYLDPQFSQKRSDLTQQLADQGIGVGNDAYSRATGDLGRQENLAYAGARDAATLAGQSEQARLFGENLASRGQGVSEAEAQGQFGNQARQQGLNERITQWGEPLTALGSAANIGEGVLAGSTGNLGGLSPLTDFAWAGQLPTYGGSPTSVYPANVVGAQNAANTAAANRFTAGNTLNNQLFNGLGTLGNAAFGGGSGGGWLGNAASGIGNWFGLGEGSAPFLTDAGAGSLADFSGLGFLGAL